MSSNTLLIIPKANIKTRNLEVKEGNERKLNYDKGSGTIAVCNLTEILLRIVKCVPCSSYFEFTSSYQLDMKLVEGTNRETMWLF